MNKKRGEISIQVLVMAVIALVVLGVVTYIFWDNIRDVAQGFKDAREQTPCRTDIIGGERCVKNCDDLEGDWEETKATCQDNLVCCKEK